MRSTTSVLVCLLLAGPALPQTITETLSLPASPLDVKWISVAAVQANTAASAFQDMYNLLGWATTVSIKETRGWLGGTTSYARLNQGQAVFQRNDFVVTMVSQAFVYPRLPNFPIGIGAQGHNHNDLSDEPVAVGIHQALKTLLIP